MRILFIVVLLLSSLATNLGAEEIDFHLKGSINNGPPLKSETLFLKKGDTLRLTFAWANPEARQGNEKSPYTVCWYRIKPVLREYSNLWSGQDPEQKGIHLEPIEYEKLLIESAPSRTTLQVNEFIAAEGCGTYYFAAKPYLNPELPGENETRFFCHRPDTQTVPG